MQILSDRIWTHLNQLSFSLWIFVYTHIHTNVQAYSMCMSVYIYMCVYVYMCTHSYVNKYTHINYTKFNPNNTRIFFQSFATGFKQNELKIFIKIFFIPSKYSPIVLLSLFLPFWHLFHQFYSPQQNIHSKTE